MIWHLQHGKDIDSERSTLSPPRVGHRWRWVCGSLWASSKALSGPSWLSFSHNSHHVPTTDIKLLVKATEASLERACSGADLLNCRYWSGSYVRRVGALEVTGSGLTGKRPLTLSSPSCPYSDFWTQIWHLMTVSITTSMLEEVIFQKIQEPMVSTEAFRNALGGCW